MDFSWKEYQTALNIVKVFEKQREEIKSKRRNFNWLRTYNNIVWEKREELNKLEYEIRNLPIERKEYLGDEFLNKLIYDKQSELLEIRKRASVK